MKKHANDLVENISLKTSISSGISKDMDKVLVLKDIFS